MFNNKKNTTTPDGKTQQNASSQLHDSRHSTELDLIADIRTTILVQSPRGGQIIVWMTLLLFILLIFWMYISEIDEITRGNGKVIPSSQLQIVQNLEGGILEETFVREGDIVNKGQLLMRLDQTRFSAPYQESRLKYLSLLAKAARLKAEAEGKEMIVQEDVINDVKVLQNQFNIWKDAVIPDEVVKERSDIASREQQLFVARQKKLVTSIAILEEQSIQRKQELAELEEKGALKAKPVSTLVPWQEKAKTKLGDMKTTRWVKQKFGDAKETVQAAKVITKLGMKKPTAFMQDPEKAVIDFLNDILVIFLIRLHWDNITQHWLLKPLKHRYEWMALFYMFFLLVRSRRKK